MNPLHHRTCRCAPCCIDRALELDAASYRRQVAAAQTEELAGRGRAFGECRPRAGTFRALTKRYGGKKAA